MKQFLTSFRNQIQQLVCITLAVIAGICPFSMKADPGNTATHWMTLSELLKKWEPVPILEIQRTAESGDASALHYLGFCHAEGIRVAQNPAEGVAWYRRALQAGYLPSANNLGFLYQRGLLGTIDYSKAVEYYRYAAERGLPQSQMNLGVMYRDGMGVNTDPKEALKWFRLAAAQGHPTAMVEVGRSYRFGNGVEADVDEAIRWFEKAANEKDSSLARLNLGLLFQDNGEADKAIPLYQKAAAAGEVEAMIQLYCCYWDGNGVAADHTKAMDWLKKAADTKNGYAEYLMGNRCETVHFEGSGGDEHLSRPDLSGALRWYSRSAEHGWANGQYRLALLYLKGRAIAKDEARAFDLIRSAAQQNLPEACKKLAQFYEQGIGEPRNIDERPVALLECARAWDQLVVHYEYGLGTDRDLVMAARSYSKMVLHENRNYSRHSLADMMDFRPIASPATARRFVEALDDHLTIIGPRHHANADASDELLWMLSPYLKSARGEGAAAFQIGELYEKGQSVPKSAPSAWSWFSIAAQNRNASARNKIQLLEKQMSANELKFAQKRLSEIQADLKEVAVVLR